MDVSYVTSTYKKRNTNLLVKRLLKNYQLYLLLLPAIIYIIIFHYGAMYGVQIAFKDFMAIKGINASPWSGIRHFERFFNSSQFWLVIKNTVYLSLYSLTLGFPVPIVFALMLNNVPNKRFKSLVQTVTYAPHFISVVVLVSMLLVFLSPSTGIINNVITKVFNIKPIFFMSQPKMFKSIYVLSGIWQSMGWSAIIYIAALAGISPDLHEAAVVDGATKLQRIIHIDIPGILPTIITLFILSAGNIMSVGFEKAYLMQNSLNLESSEIISTYVYRVGLLGADFSYSTAVGLFNSVINFALLLVVNKIAKRTTDVGLF